MPQMKPMVWLIMLMIISLFFIILLSLMYFLPLPLFFPHFSSTPHIKKLYYWKWEW